MEKSRHGLSRVMKAFAYSRAGLAAAWRHEAAFREEVVLILLLLPLAWWLGDDGVQRALLSGSLLLILLVELLNSAIEAEVDRVGEEYNLLAGRAKDLGSAAVLVSFCHAALIWGLILWE